MGAGPAADRLHHRETRPHDAGVAVAQQPPEVRHQIGRGKGPRIQHVEAVHRENALLAHHVGLVVHQLPHFRRDGGDHVRRDEPRHRHERHRRLQDVGAPQVPLQLVHQHETKLVARREARAARHVPSPLVQDARTRGELHRLDVPEAGVVAQHLHVHETHQELAGPLFRRVQRIGAVRGVGVGGGGRRVGGGVRGGVAGGAEHVAGAVGGLVERPVGVVVGARVGRKTVRVRRTRRTRAAIVAAGGGRAREDAF
mmetsp:Transcript_30189/g.59784  ORF Transcript_30189/g.59784 Transcript_30189/m.59784 type:complete len:255 (+) Transcript_30189:2486-3250(+)